MRVLGFFLMCCQALSANAWWWRRVFNMLSFSSSVVFCFVCVCMCESAFFLLLRCVMFVEHEPMDRFLLSLLLQYTACLYGVGNWTSFLHQPGSQHRDLSQTVSHSEAASSTYSSIL
ncbi:hypothetical protein V8C42DRAFT_312810 [Trichoderma barbatum]